MILGHCHVGVEGHFKRLIEDVNDAHGTIGHLGRYIGELGFNRAVVFAPFKRWFDGDPNEWLLGAVKDDERFIPWVTVNEPGRAAVEMLQTYGPAGARGIKFHPPVVKIAVNDVSLSDFYTLAELWRMPVLFHTGPHGWNLSAYQPLRIDEVAQRHPKLPIIVEHLGGKAFVRETHALMQNNRNVYGGLATCLLESATWSVPMAEVKDMIVTFGADRFVWGADFPWNRMETNRKALKVLKSFDLSDADLSLILSGNLERLNECVSL